MSIGEPGTAVSNLKGRHLLHCGQEFLEQLIVRAKGAYIYTEDGRTMLHLDSTMLSPDVVELADRLCGLLSLSLGMAQFLNTGGEANEAAIRLAKIASGRFLVIGMAGFLSRLHHRRLVSDLCAWAQKLRPCDALLLGDSGADAYRCPMHHSPGTVRYDVHGQRFRYDRCVVGRVRSGAERRVDPKRRRHRGAAGGVFPAPARS